MRRVCSTIPFVIGGCLLTSVSLFGLLPVYDASTPWTWVVELACYAGPFLLLGCWISPGNRRAELGLTLMNGAAGATLIILMLAAIAADEAYLQVTETPMPKFDFASEPMILTIAMMAGSGLLLWAWQASGAENDGK